MLLLRSRSMLTAVAVCLVVWPGRLPAQDGRPYEPQLNQPGKDVQWVPTPPALVERMLDLAHVTSRDRVVDLGSGDGVLVIAAAKRGARARGIEYDGRLVEFARRRAVEEGVAERTKFVRGDIFRSDFSDASVVTSFLLPSMNYQLRFTFLKMKPGTRIVANTFGVGDWEPDDTAIIEPCERWCKALLWVVPARVGGTWRTPHGSLTVTQRYQVLTGTLGAHPLRNGRLRGTDVVLEVEGTTFRGSVDGTRMRIRAEGGSEEEVWTAVTRSP